MHTSSGKKTPACHPAKDRVNTILKMAALLVMTAASHPGSAAEAADPSWKSFQHALGQPALIGANADHERAASAFRPIPAFSQSEIDANKLRLGFDLFHERRLSVDNSVGCNSCHSGMFGGTDGRVVSTGANGVSGKMNSPTTFNAGFNFRQFWDGRAVTLEQQALGPVENELEMAHDLSSVLAMLQNDSNYAAEFASVYDDGVTIQNMADAIAYFQRVNFTRAGTPFVRHLEGEEGQLSEQALRGMQRFEEVGCASCHNGINLGGNSYQALGSLLPWFGDDRVADPDDTGLMARSGRAGDEHVFKVPTLHGVAETAPYFHDGSVDTLEQAIAEMAEHQLGRMLSQQDIDDIAAFLHSTGGRPMGMAMGNAGMGRGMGMRNGMGGHMSGGMRGGMRGGMGSGMHHAGNTAAAPAPIAETDAVPAVGETTDAHHLAYLNAVSVSISAPEKILAEMRRIQSGEIAHFDFLQYQHLELIRHVSALQYPPSTLTADTAKELQAAAQTLLTEVHQLEWTISDFLRAEAVTRALQTHVARPETSELAQELGDIAGPLQESRTTSQNMLDQMAASPVRQLAVQLEQLYKRS